MKNRDVIEIVKASNLPEDAMLYVLCAVADTCGGWHEKNRMFREKILSAMPIGEPIRIKTIRENALPRFSNQRITHQMKNLVYAGVVKREEVETGNTITITAWERVPDAEMWCGFRYEEVEKQIPEKIAYFIRVR